MFPERGNVEDNASLQDERHLHYLGVIQTEFQNCFKNYDIEVDIKWSDHTVPSMPEHIILKRLKNKKLESIEEYRKTIVVDHYGKSYEEMVTCYKTMFLKDGTERKFVKVQSFNGREREWKPHLHDAHS